MPVTDRASALAARIDAMLDDDDDEPPARAAMIDRATTVNPADDGVPREIPRAESRGDMSGEASLELDELEEVNEPVRPTPPPIAMRIPPPPAMRIPPPVPGTRPIMMVPPRPPLAIPPMRAAVPGRSISQPIPTVPAPPVAIPQPIVAIPVPVKDSTSAPIAVAAVEPARAKRHSVPPPPPHAEEARARRASVPPPTSATTDDAESEARLDNGGGDSLEIGTGQANIVIDQPLEAYLDTPTVVDRAIAELGDAGSEKRAELMLRELEATADNAAAGMLAYELGELYERRLADEARAVKAYGRAITLDPSLRPNLWAIRRVFYRRGLWPNLAKLIAAEVAYALDDHERADLLLEKARIVGHQLADETEARAVLEEAVKLAPRHQGALLELERVISRANDRPALLEVWESLADAVEQPARKVAYWLEVGRGAVGAEYPRAQAAFDLAAQTAATLPNSTAIGERIARERLRVAEEHGTPADVAAAIDALRVLLLASFGPAGPSSEGVVGAEGRATLLRRELVALHRRQAQLHQRAGVAEQAWDTLQQALALAPGEPILLADLTELAEELGRYEDLAELVQSWQAVEGDPARALGLSIRRADALLRGGQRDQARALLASLEASAPGFIVLTSAAERDALGRDDVGELAKTYLTAAHAALLGTWQGPGQAPQPDPASAAALYVQAAELLAYDLGGDALEEARTALGKALEAVPDHAPALEALTALDDQTGRVAEALVRLRAQAVATELLADKQAILDRAIRLARGHGDLDAVLGLEQEVARLAPHDLAIKWRIESTLAQLGRDDERAVLLAELAAVETDAARRGTALLAAARLRERAGAVEVATDLYRQVLALWPEDTFARESLIDLLRAQERWTELVTERRTEARALPDGAAARRALREATWVLEVRLGDIASAALVYTEWLLRYPDDRTALEGAARCRAMFGDRGGEVTARQAIGDIDLEPEAQWLLARSFERAGQFDEAADAYRQLAVRPEPSVAATSAAFGLADLAAGRADNVMRVEATAALAGRTQDPRLGAALAEDSGWMYALVLEDFDRAALSFEAAISLDATRRGALLGAALVAARRGEPVQLAQAYEGLANSVQMPEAAAALHLRAAAMAAAAADLELANARVLFARAAAPDDTSALLVVAETGAAAIIDTASGDRETIIDPLLARAEVLEMRGALADDPTARASWELDRAEALELAGRLRESCAVVVAVLKGQPDDLRGLEALRRLADRAGDKPTWARACFQLARVLGDPTARVALLREAATVFDGPSPDGDRNHALATYRRIVAVDPSAAEMDRLLGLLREGGDIHGLIGVLTDKLTWLGAQDRSDPQQLVPLLLERATILHGLGDGAASIADLDALLERAPQNVEALRFRADLAFAAGDVDTAIALWRRYIAAETRAPRRAEVELQLSQVLAENVNDVVGAIENLERVVEQSPEDVLLRERLVGLCLRANDWQRAAREMRALARQRPTPQDKAKEELRLALLQRDKLDDRTSARLSLDRARTLDPLNLDVVRELSELLDPNARGQMLAASIASLRSSIAQGPGRAVLYERLAQVTAWQSDVDARWLALVGLEALGQPTPDQKQVLAQGRQKLPPPARQKLVDAERAAFRATPLGALGEVWKAIAPSVQVATGVDPGKLGFVRGDKLAQKKVGEKYEPLAIALANFGIEDIELYISSSRTGIARAVGGETPILCIGADIAAAATPQSRFWLGKVVASIADGVGTIGELRDGELQMSIVAALKAAEVSVPTGLAELVVGDDTAVAERTRVLKKELSRKAKAVLAQLVAQRSAELVEVLAFRRTAIAIGQRAGLLWSGDLGVALALLDVGKGGKSLLDSPAALDLVAWSVGETHGKLRDKLGIALRGTR